MTVWMKVSDDEYRLPEVIADSPSELGRLLGVNPNTISSSITHAREKGRVEGCRYVRVDFEDDDMGEDHRRRMEGDSL